MEQARNPSTSRLDLRIRLVVFADGERCPMLMDVATGIPLFDPTVWTLTVYRRHSASTMEQALRGAMLIHIFCALRGIELVARVRSGIFFSASELDDLEREAGKPIRMLAGRAAGNAATDAVGDRQTTARCYRTSDKARFLRRLQSAETVDAVDRQTRSLRLHYLRDYLKWLGDRESFKIGSNIGDGNSSDRFKKEYDGALVARVAQNEG
jgi:hypothetical protein